MRNNNENNNSNWLRFGLGICVAIIAVLIIDNFLKRKRNENLEQEVKEKDSLVDEMKKIISDLQDMPLDTKNKLQSLIQNYEGIDAKTEGELRSVLSLLMIKEYAKSLLSLTKIIENQLKSKFRNNQTFIQLFHKKKNPTLLDFLEFAHTEKMISSEHYHIIQSMRVVRNQAAHELFNNIDKESTIYLIGASTNVIKTLSASN